VKESTNNPLLDRLYPLHIVLREDGVIVRSSEQIDTLFPVAQTIFDILAPNSAQELLNLMSNPGDNATERASIDVFSIQLMTTWWCKITRYDDQGNWIIGMETLERKKPTELKQELLTTDEILELQRKTFFYEALLQQLPAELAVFDPEFKFLFVNQHAIKNEELRKWLIGRNEIEYWKSKNLPLDKTLARIEAFKKAVDERKASAVEEVFHAGTEREKHYVRITHPYFKEDELRFLLSYGIDITTLKQTENKLIQQNAELEKVNAELDQFVYSASHNLRAPLLSMKGLLSLISLEDTAFSDRNRFMQEVYKAIERLDATIHDIIEYSKNARLAIAPHHIDILQLIHAAADDFKFIDSNRVSIQVNSDLQAPLHSDEGRLRSIIHNLTSNSVKYADHSKYECYLKITISVNATNCQLTFEDNGIGIASENQEHVFDMFYRATTERTGSGLGLYIVKEMVHKLGGSMELKSEKGVGTVMSICIPNLLSDEVQ
jgi:signal transduction histidine kinase